MHFDKATFRFNDCDPIIIDTRIDYISSRDIN